MISKLTWLNRISDPGFLPSALHSHAAGVAEKGADCFHEVAEAAAATWGGPEGHVYRSVGHAEVEGGSNPATAPASFRPCVLQTTPPCKCGGGQAKRCSSLLRWDACFPCFESKACSHLGWPSFATGRGLGTSSAGNLGCSQAGMSVYSDNSELHISNRPNQRGEDRRGCSTSERIGASESVNQ